VSGTALNSETQEPLEGLEILLAYSGGGIAGSAVTQSDGSFSINGIEDGNYELEFYTFPDPVIINGDYFLNTTYENTVIVNGDDLSDIEFEIPPHHANFTLTGVLYDAETNDTIKIQDFQVQAKMQYLIELFNDFETENGMYILENMPDWSYDFNVFKNDYYEGISTIITTSSTDPDMIYMDFYLQPKTGATISGVLLDSTNNEPVMQAGRTIKLQASNSLFTETNEDGEFSFVNVPTGTYGGIEVSKKIPRFHINFGIFILRYILACL